MKFTLVLMAFIGLQAAPCFAQDLAKKSSNPSLELLAKEEAEDLFKRAPGCRASITRIADAQIMGVVADASRVMLRTTDRTVEMGIISRDSGNKGPAVQFSATSKSYGGTMNGVLEATGKERKCALSPECMEVPARMSFTLRNPSGDIQKIFDGEVIVVDQCGADSRKRLFMTVPWWQKPIRLITGH